MKFFLLTIRFAIAFKLYFIAFSYRPDLCKFEKLPLYKKFYKAVCVCWKE